MIERNCGVPEERWIDWHLRRLPPETARALERHLETCPDCRRTCGQWAEWLGKPPEGTAGSAAETPMPSERVHRSLRLAMWRLGWRKRWKKRLARRPLVLAGTALAAALLLGVVLLQETSRSPANEAGPAELPPMEYARQHVPAGAVLMEAPDTKVYTATPAFAPGLPQTGSKKAVTVWVNGRTDEMFVLIEGLLPAQANDVQAWGTDPGGLTNLGLVEFHQAQGHLYARLSRLREMEDLSFTIEPKGGSQRPTAPETAHLKLKEGR